MQQRGFRSATDTEYGINLCCRQWCNVSFSDSSLNSWNWPSASLTDWGYFSIIPHYLKLESFWMYSFCHLLNAYREFSLSHEPEFVIKFPSCILDYCACHAGNGLVLQTLILLTRDFINRRYGIWLLLLRRNFITIRISILPSWILH